MAISLLAPWLCILLFLVWNELDPASVFLADVSRSFRSRCACRTFISANVSSVKTSNLEVMPGATFLKPGLIDVEYLLYMEGMSAISAIARLHLCQDCKNPTTCETYCMPIHIRAPLENGHHHFFISANDGYLSFPNHLSGSHFKGSGKISAFRCSENGAMEHTVPRGTA